MATFTSAPFASLKAAKKHLSSTINVDFFHAGGTSGEKSASTWKINKNTLCIEGQSTYFVESTLEQIFETGSFN